MLSSVDEKLRAILRPAEGRVQSRPSRLRLPVLTGGWEGLVGVISALAPAYAQVKSAEAQQAAAEAEAARLEVEKLRLATMPEAKAVDFLKRYWPYLGAGTIGLIVLAVAFRKRK